MAYELINRPAEYVSVSGYNMEPRSAEYVSVSGLDFGSIARKYFWGSEGSWVTKLIGWGTVAAAIGGVVYWRKRH